MAASHGTASLFISIKNFFSKLFQRVDTDGSGSITLPEFQKILQDIKASGGIANALMSDASLWVLPEDELSMRLGRRTDVLAGAEASPLQHHRWQQQQQQQQQQHACRVLDTGQFPPPSPSDIGHISARSSVHEQQVTCDV